MNTITIFTLVIIILIALACVWMITLVYDLFLMEEQLKRKGDQLNANRKNLEKMEEGGTSIQRGRKGHV